MLRFMGTVKYVDRTSQRVASIPLDTGRKNRKKYVSKQFAGANAGNAGGMCSIPWSGRSPGEENSYPLWDSRLENSVDRGAWQTMVHGAAKSQTQLSDWAQHKGEIINKACE